MPNDIAPFDLAKQTVRSAAPRMPLALAGADDELLQQAYHAYSAHAPSVPALISGKVAMLRCCDVPGMEDAVSICFWGRSGSWLLQSYLDGHDDVIVLPRNASQWIYPFLRRFASCSLWDRLIAYPTYTECKDASEGVFLSGEFAVRPPHFYAAVHALFELYGDRPSPWLNTRQRFFQFLHAAYAAAADRLAGRPRPLIVYAQHWTNEGTARLFIEDFPRGRFIHTIRDPISCVDSWYERQITMQTFMVGQRPGIGVSDAEPWREALQEELRSESLGGRLLGRSSSRYEDPSGQAVRSLFRWDRAHTGMEERTRAIRFEDLHLAPEATMRRLARWLGISYRPCLLESTFNGIPYVYEGAGNSWVGANPRNAARRSRNLGFVDRALIFALLHQNFVAWDYPSASAFRRGWIRLGAIALLFLVPMKIEWLNARLVLVHRALPALREGRIAYACGAPAYLIMRRFVMMTFIAAQMCIRITAKRKTLEVL